MPKYAHPDEPKQVVEAKGDRADLLKRCGWVEQKKAQPSTKASTS